MNHEYNRIHRAPFALAALAMTALTLGLTIVAPAKLDSGYAELRVAAQAPAEVTSRCPCADLAHVQPALVQTATADAGCRQST